MNVMCEHGSAPEPAICAIEPHGVVQVQETVSQGGTAKLCVWEGEIEAGVAGGDVRSSITSSRASHGSVATGLPE